MMPMQMLPQRQLWRSSLKISGIELRHGESVLTSPCSQDFDAFLGDQEGVLKLRGTPAAPAHGRPIVWPDVFLATRSQIEHGLHGEDVAGLHNAHSLVPPVMWHIRRTMEELAHAMAAKGRHHSAAVLDRDRVYGVSKIAVERARPDHLAADSQSVVRRSHQGVRLLVALPDEECLVQIGVEALVINTDVQVHNVAFFDGPAIGDAVANHLVRRHAQRLREAAIIQRTGIQLPLLASFPHHPIDLVTCDSSFHEPGSYVQHLPAQAAYFPHGLKVRPSHHRNRTAGLRLGEGSAFWVQSIVGQTAVGRRLHLRGDVRGTQLAAELVSLEVRWHG
mmetsp:Transcript_116618/g.341335  ORF Transcript_116618/g.341335 Transcript_116618/m.341335 type:complete len:334 (+) Transcript_116618:3-1004(+)